MVMQFLERNNSKKLQSYAGGTVKAPQAKTVGFSKRLLQTASPASG